MHVRALSELWPTLSPAAARSNDDGRVLARIVRLADAHDEPGAGTTLQQVAHLEDLVGEPVLSTAVGIDDRERAGQLSPSAPPGAMAQAWVTAEGELLARKPAYRSARFACFSPMKADSSKYGRKHQIERRRWQSEIAAGRGVCAICGRPIVRDAHSSLIRDLGPAHTRCGFVEGELRKRTGRDW